MSNPNNQNSAGTASAENNPSFPGIEAAQVITTPVTVPLPVRVALNKQAREVGLSASLIEKIIRVVSRQDTSAAVPSGRSYIVRLNPNEWFQHSGLTFRSIRPKLVTHNGRPPHPKRYVDGPNEVIKQPHYRLSLDSENRLHWLPALAHPEGGGFFSEALNEHDTMLEAFEKGVPTGLPLAVGDFPAMPDFEGQRMGFLWIAHESGVDQRLGLIVYNLMLSRHTMKEGYRNLNKGLPIAAQTLRKFHAMGLAHGHPHIGNFGMARDKNVPLFDFTNAKSFRQMTRDEFIVRMFNDFRAFYCSVYFLCTQAHHPMGLTPTEYRMVIDTLRSPSPLDELVNGYFTPEDLDQLGTHRIKDATKMDGFVALQVAFAPSMEDKRFSELNHPLARLFEDLAGREYDRLLDVNRNSI